jgi:hypothetical protein
MSRHPTMTEQEIDDAIPALINWFESQQINPRDSGRVMIKLLAAEYVRKSIDAAELQDAVDLTAWMLAIDIAGFLPPKGQRKKAKGC